MLSVLEVLPKVTSRPGALQAVSRVPCVNRNRLGALRWPGKKSCWVVCSYTFSPQLGF